MKRAYLGRFCSRRKITSTVISIILSAQHFFSPSTKRARPLFPFCEQRLANINRHRTRNFFASVRETRVSRRTNGRALCADPQSVCAFVIRLGDFIGSSRLVGSYDRSLDRPTAINVAVGFFTPRRFRLNRPFFSGCFRSNNRVFVLFPRSFLAFASAPPLPASICCQLIHCRFLSKFCLGKSQILAISVYQSAYKFIERLFDHLMTIRSFCNRAYLCSYNTQ